MTRVSLPWGAKAWTSTRSKRRASSRADQRARLKTAWNRLKWVSCSCPVARRAAVTVRRPRARIVPVTRTWAFSHVGRVKTERKWDKTDRMGVERDISGRSEGGSSIVSTRYYDPGHRDVPLRGYPVTIPCNSRYLNGTAFFDGSGFNSLSIR